MRKIRWLIVYPAYETALGITGNCACGAPATCKAVMAPKDQPPSVDAPGKPLCPTHT